MEIKQVNLSVCAESFNSAQIFFFSSALGLKRWRRASWVKKEVIHQMLKKLQKTIRIAMPNRLCTRNSQIAAIKRDNTGFSMQFCPPSTTATKN